MPSKPPSGLALAAEDNPIVQQSCHSGRWVPVTVEDKVGEGIRYRGLMLPADGCRF